MAVSWHLLATALIVAFGSSFQSGYFVSLYNVPQDIIEQYINKSVYSNWHKILTPVQVSTIWATIASANQAGKVIACFVSPVLADRLGRKWTLQFSSILSIVGILLQYVSQPTNSFLLLAAGRFITGLYNGVVGVIVPLFLVEIAVVPSWRGGVTRIHNVVTILGNILSLLFGIPEILGTSSRWGYLALIPLPLVILEIIWLFFVPESPMFVLQRGAPEQVIKKSLRYYLGDSADSIEQNVRAAVHRKKQQEKDEEAHGRGPSWKDICKNPILRQGCVLWIMLSLASSFSGGNITNNYLTSMIAGQSVKFSDFDKYSSVTVNAIKIMIVLGALYFIDKVGRKPLLLVTMWGVLVCFVILAGIEYSQTAFGAVDKYSATWTRIVFLFLLCCIQYTVNSTATLVVSETASQNSRALSLSIYKIGYHLSSVFLTFAFPPLFRYSQGGCYVFFAVPYFLICIYLSMACPETKNTDLFIQDQSEKTPLLKLPEMKQVEGDDPRLRMHPVASSRT